jgi:hypothetical protein
MRIIKKHHVDRRNCSVIIGPGMIGKNLPAIDEEHIKLEALYEAQ